MKLFPPPKVSRTATGRLDTLAPLPLVVHQGLPRRLRNACTRFAARHEAVFITTRADLPRAIQLKLSGKHPGDEAHSLKITPNGVSITSSSESGLFRGLSTLSQMLRQAKSSIRCCEIKDVPDFANRGVMLDISRCKVPTLTTLKTLIEQFADLKYNQLQLYTEHTFAFTDHETVWRDASPLTASDILELQAHCQSHYIELVPNLNSFGHFERWLRHSEYRAYAECPDGFIHPLSGKPMPHGSTLRPTAASLDLVSRLYDEYLPLFDSNTVNIGGDEPWELGLGYSRRRCEREGKTKVYLDFLNRLQTLAKKKGRRTQFWGDIVLEDPASLTQLSTDATAMIWGYEAGHPFEQQCALMAEAKVPFYVCPGTSSWNSLTGRLDNATKNLYEAASAGANHGAMGYLVTDWGDHGHHQTLPVSYPGFVLGASASWNAASSVSRSLSQGINLVFLDQQAPSLAERIVTMGKFPQLIKTKAVNATVFNHLLFWRMRHAPKWSSGISDVELERTVQVMKNFASESLNGLSPANGRVLRETQLGAAMAQQGLLHLQLFRDGGKKANKRRREVMRGQLASIQNSHKALWLERNRPGGLKESLSHLAINRRY
jgi:hexosaminidase